MGKVPSEFLKRIKGVTNKRARLVLDRIAKNGSITTEELKDIGYDHPPRARMDAPDLGFPIITKRVKSSSGKSIAAYSFDLKQSVCDSRAGRIALPKRNREEIIAVAGHKCQLCAAKHDLQVDHRVPFQVAGESLKDKPDSYMVLCGSCNRRKSWICEHCANFAQLKSIAKCQSCYWANPQMHTHVALEEIRRIDLVWEGDDAKAFDTIREKCKREGRDLPTAIKELVRSGK